MNTYDFFQFIAGVTQEFTPVLSSEFQKQDYMKIDLSLANQDLKKVDVSSSDSIEKYINKQLIQNDAKVAYGGYKEVRGIYRRSTHFNQSDPETERNIHLGLDLWCSAGTRVLAPLEGKIHSFKNNINYGDYGPTIILEHTIAQVTFYTLYGHLSTDSIATLSIGQFFDQGQEIASLGDNSVNGSYAPHLHFQVIRDLQGYAGDYPGS